MNASEWACGVCVLERGKDIFGSTETKIAEMLAVCNAERKAAKKSSFVKTLALRRGLSFRQSLQI